MSPPSAVPPIRSSYPIQVFIATVPTAFAAAATYLLASFPLVLRPFVGTLGWGSLVLLEWRLISRSCTPLTDGLRVRGFWRTYEVPWADIRALASSHFEPRYMWFFGARVFVQFVDECGRQRAVAVSSNRRRKTAQSKTATVRNWLPSRVRDRVVAVEDFWTPPETVWEWRPVR